MFFQKQATPPDRTKDIALCTCANLRMATRVVTQLYDAALAPVGLKATQFTLLSTLHELGEARLTELADKLVMDRTTLTRNLKPLIERRLIEESGERDRRVRRLSLSTEGLRTIKEAMPHWERIQTRTVEGLGNKSWQSLLDDLAIAVSVAQTN